MEKTTTIVGGEPHREQPHLPPQRSLAVTTHLRDWPAQLDAWTQRRPVQALLVVAGLGYAIGKLLQLAFWQEKEARAVRRPRRRKGTLLARLFAHR